MFKRPLSRQMARELKPAEIDQVSGGGGGDMMEVDHMTYTGGYTRDQNGRPIDDEAIRDPN